MTELEKRVEEYVETKGKEHFRKFYDEQLSMADLLKKCCVDFAKQETKLLSKHILELQKDKGRLTDELTEAKRLLKNWQKEFDCKLSFNERAELVKNTAAFIDKE